MPRLKQIRQLLLIKKKTENNKTKSKTVKYFFKNARFKKQKQKKIVTKFEKHTTFMKILVFAVFVFLLRTKSVEFA